ncbi:hypothetical protein SNEBB_006774 [Seison nebaliae]|nr:hypothetical protein SNEBB_006774 [Seison nebaliae]
MHKFRTNSQPWLVTNVQNSPEIPFVINFTNGTLSNSSLEDKPINYTQSKLYYESDTIKTNLRCMNNLNKSSTDIWPSSAKKNFGNTKNILLNLKIQCEKYKMFQIQTKFLVADFDFTSKKIKHNYHFTLDKLAELRKKFSNFSLTINPFIRANETDTKFIFLSPVLTLNESTKTIPKVLFIDHEFFELQIYQKDKLPYTKVYTEVYYNWQTSKMVESMERKRFEINNKIQHFPYNVLVLGIDSLSSQHMERLLPKSFDYATKKMKFDYFRNSQVSGGNTYPNLMALLSGVMELNITTYTSKGTIIEEHDDQYLRINSSFYDTLPFTWKLLPKYYTTVMIEDYYWIAMFNYLKKGFSFSPTDVYMRPYFTQSEKYATDICDRCALFYELVNDYLEYIEREFQLNSENDMLLPFYFLSFHKKCSHDRIFNFRMLRIIGILFVIRYIGAAFIVPVNWKPWTVPIKHVTTSIPTSAAKTTDQSFVRNLIITSREVSPISHTTKTLTTEPTTTKKPMSIHFMPYLSRHPSGMLQICMPFDSSSAYWRDWKYYFDKQ